MAEVLFILEFFCDFSCTYFFFWSVVSFFGTTVRVEFENTERPQVNQAQEYQDPLALDPGESIL